MFAEKITLDVLLTPKVPWWELFLPKKEEEGACQASLDAKQSPIGVFYATTLLRSVRKVEEEEIKRLQKRRRRRRKEGRGRRKKNVVEKNS
jgi:hypothetical protein